MHRGKRNHARTRTFIKYYNESSDNMQWKMVGLSGLEPPTSRLSGVRSDQLSYRPIKSG